MRKATNRRPQTSKGRAGGTVVKSGNPAYVEGIQNLRRGSAAQPHKPKTAYSRKTRANTIPEV
jgi:hypothetical protein